MPRNVIFMWISHSIMKVSVSSVIPRFEKWPWHQIVFILKHKFKVKISYKGLGDWVSVISYLFLRLLRVFNSQCIATPSPLYFVSCISSLLLKNVAYAPFKNTGDYPKILYLTFKLFIIPSPLEDVFKYL